MALKLNQVIAVEKTVKSRGNRAFTEAYQLLQKAGLLDGQRRVSRNVNEGDPEVPGEYHLPQTKVVEINKALGIELADMFNVVAQKDFANTDAKADIVVDGEIIATGVPVTYLLFLEKQLEDLWTYVSKLPVLDPAVKWQFDNNVNYFSSEKVTTARTKKVHRNHTLAEATDKHPAQVQMYQEDVIVGYWDTTKFSGAIPAEQREILKNRVEALQRAVKTAREEANGIEAPKQDVGIKVMEFIFS